MIFPHLCPIPSETRPGGAYRQRPQGLVSTPEGTCVLMNDCVIGSSRHLRLLEKLELTLKTFCVASVQECCRTVPRPLAGDLWCPSSHTLISKDHTLKPRPPGSMCCTAPIHLDFAGLCVRACARVYVCVCVCVCVRTCMHETYISDVFVLKLVDT